MPETSVVVLITQRPLTHTVPEHTRSRTVRWAAAPVRSRSAAAVIAGAAVVEQLAD